VTACYALIEDKRNAVDVREFLSHKNLEILLNRHTVLYHPMTFTLFTHKGSFPLGLGFPLAV
jgi:hypothetical protein